VAARAQNKTARTNITVLSANEDRELRKLGLVVMNSSWVRCELFGED
jgi:hypothetical protein